MKNALTTKPRMRKTSLVRTCRWAKASVAIAVAGMVFANVAPALAETYYWDRGTAIYSTANGWTTIDGSTTITYTSPTVENYTDWAEDDFVVRTGRAIATDNANENSYYFNTKSLTLEGANSRFYYRGANLYNCHFILCGGSILYCRGRNDARYYSALQA